MATNEMNQLNINTPDGKSYAFAVVDQEARDLAQQALAAAGSGGTGGDCNVQRIESLDDSNLKNLRDLDSGTYILYGYFTPFSGSPDSITIDSCIAAAVHLNAGSHVMVYNPRNFKIECYEILENDGSYTYTRDVVSLLNLNALIDKVGDMDGLNTTEKSSLVAAINEVAANAGSGSDSSQNGNGGGLSEDAVSLLMDFLGDCKTFSDKTDTLALLRVALRQSGSGSGTETPTEGVTLENGILHIRSGVTVTREGNILHIR